MADTRDGSTLLKTEDWLAGWLGFLIIVLGLAGGRPGMPKVPGGQGGGVAGKAQDAGLKKKGADLGKKIAGDAGAYVGKVFSGENIWKAVVLGVGYLIVSAIRIDPMSG